MPGLPRRIALIGPAGHPQGTVRALNDDAVVRI